MCSCAISKCASLQDPHVCCMSQRLPPLASVTGFWILLLGCLNFAVGRHRSLIVAHGLQALNKLDSSITQDSLAVTEDPVTGIALSLQGVSVSFAPGNPFEKDLEFDFVLSFGAGTFAVGCKATGYLRMGNSAKPDEGHAPGAHSPHCCHDALGDADTGGI